jgi:hypothetical protein
VTARGATGRDQFIASPPTPHGAGCDTETGGHGADRRSIESSASTTSEMTTHFLPAQLWNSHNFMSYHPGPLSQPGPTYSQVAYTSIRGSKVDLTVPLDLGFPVCFFTRV